jgi:hypothetical protein
MAWALNPLRESNERQKWTERKVRRRQGRDEGDTSIK